MWVRGVDTSTAARTAPISPAVFSHWRRRGIHVFVHDLWHGGRPAPTAKVQLQNAAAAGLVVMGYYELIPGVDPHAQLSAIALELGEVWSALRAIAVDVELDGVNTELLEAGITAVELHQKQPIIYTGKWFWDRQEYRDSYLHIPLWYARYDGKRSVRAGELPGAWRREDVIGKQYRNNVTLNGVTVDLNIFRRRFVYADKLQRLVDDSITHYDVLWGTAEELLADTQAGRWDAARAEELRGRIQAHVVALKQALEELQELF